MCPAKTTIDCILKSLNSLAPFSLAAGWDNVGLLIGAPGTTVTGIMIGLDPTTELLDEAIAQGANLVITHHPIIFSALKAIRTDQPTGALIAKAITKQIALIACHTNLDVIPAGVSTILAHRLGMTDLTVLDAIAPGEPSPGFGQIGTLPVPVAGRDFLAHLCAVLGVPAVTVAGQLPETVQRLAVCGGSGADLAAKAQASGAQLFVTAEVKHHLARWAEEANFCIVDAGHYATEHLSATALAAMLTDILANNTVSTPVFTTNNQKNPFSFFMAENDQ